MKLKPAQIVGLIAIVVFGGILVSTLLKGPRDPDLLPSGVRLSDLPSSSVPDIQMPPLKLSPPAPVPPLDRSSPAPAGSGTFDYPGQPDYLNVGSQAAKDDIYCSGVVSPEFDANPKQPPDDMSKQIEAMRALDQAGLRKLIGEGVATEQNGAGFTLAYAAKAKTDYAAKTLRIPFAACMTRAATVPPATG